MSCPEGEGGELSNVLDDATFAAGHGVDQEGDRLGRATVTQGGGHHHLGTALRRARRSVRLYRDVVHADRLPLDVFRAMTPEWKDAARRLQAVVYLQRGNVEPSQLDDEGRLDEATDPYAEQSDYYVVVTSDSRCPVASGRMILPGGSTANLQVVDRGLVDPEMLTIAIGEGTVPPESIAEVSAFAHLPGVTPATTILLMQAMIHDPATAGITHWVVALTGTFEYYMRYLVGDSLKRLSEPVQLPMSNNHVVPCLLPVENLAAIMDGRTRETRFLQRRLCHALHALALHPRATRPVAG